MSDSLTFPKPHLSTVALERTYLKGQVRIPVLRGVEMTVNRGEFLSIVGQSGSGKSTLLHLMGLLDEPNIGEVRLHVEATDDRPAEALRIDNLPSATRDALRNRVFGFIFQAYHLLPELTVLENVQSPLMIRESVLGYWKNRREFRERACEIIDRVGLSHRLKHRPSELSGGEMQRAAIARSLISKPEILLADEPTGNLDSQTGHDILDLLKSLNEDGLTIVMVTHDDNLAQQADRIMRLANGRSVDLAGEVAA
ncbi:MAG: ABC transporter ATP-binding protein [Planctomycetota bacterium]|jgi:lipoprotein-releasing system ATP-binding protein